MKLNIKILVLTLCVLMFVPAGFADAPFQIESQFGEMPQISVSQKVYPFPTELLSSIQPLKINDPYAAAGQPVIIEFTLSNIGHELGYPFNSIPLTPDNYTLVMMVDNSYDGVILPDAVLPDGKKRKIDIWSMMTVGEQFGYAWGTSASSFGDFVSRQIEGRSCGYVNVWTLFPKHIQDYITTQNNGKRPKGLYIWDCIKIVEEDFFIRKINQVCQGTITTKCISQINEHSYVGSTAMVMLSSASRGHCSREADEGILQLIGSAITNKLNIVDCGIGENGLQPRESVTLRFVGLIPADAPVLPPEDFLKETSITSGFTQSVSCLSSAYPEACHTIYAAVYPTAKDNFVNIFLNTTVGNAIKGGKMILGSLYNLDIGFAVDTVLTSGGITPRVVGNPIWEGRGIFYVVSSALRGEITLILYLAMIAGVITTAAVRRKTGVS